MNLVLLILGGLFLLAAFLSKQQLRRIAFLLGGVYVLGFYALLHFAGDGILVAYSILGFVLALLFSRWHVRKAFQSESTMFGEARQAAGAYLGAGIVLILVGAVSSILHFKTMTGIAFPGALLVVLGLWQYWNVRHFEKQRRPT